MRTKIILAFAFHAYFYQFAFTAGFCQTTVTIKYIGKDSKSAKQFVTPLADGNYLIGKRIQASPDPNGFIRLKINLEKPGFVYTSTETELLEIYLEPFKNVWVEIGKEVVFKGDLKKENRYLQNFYHTFHKSGLYDAEVKLIRTPMDSLTDSLTKEIERELMVLEKSLEGIPGPLKEFVSTNLKLFFYSKASSAIQYRINKSKRESQYNASLQSKWDEIHRSLFKDDLITSNLVSSSWYAEYLDQYMGYEWSKLGPYTTEEEAVLRTSSMVNRHLSGKGKEIFISHYISLRTLMGATSYTMELVDFYNQFKKEFPASGAMAVLDPRMKEVEKFVSADLSKSLPGVTFIDDFKQISTFEHLMAAFKGKVVLIDVWATWCGPCIEEFKYYGKVKDLQERNDFAVLFISRDKVSDELQWRKFIAARNLQGFHLIPNDQLEEQLKQLLNWSSIPRYAIVDKNGTLVNSDAASPSSGNLIGELNKYLRADH